MKNSLLFYCFVSFLIGSTASNAQSLLDELEKKVPVAKQFEIATFKTTRVALGHSVETRSKGALEISMFNRYWNIPNFDGQRFLADKVSTRFALEYAVSDRFTFGAGYTHFDKITDGFFKYRLMRQMRNSKKNPVSITVLQGLSYRDVEEITPAPYPGFEAISEFGFTTQVLIARKFNPKFSAQVAPTFIRRRASSSSNDPSNQFAVGFSGRHKIGGHASIVSEYYWVANPLKSIDTYNTFVVGVNWELSHLMLQFHITNARNYAEDTWITRTTNNFNFEDGNFHFGFNATFVLHTRKKKLR